MNLKQSINNKLNEFIVLCKTNNVKSIYAFGSSVSGNFNDKSSDFDFLIEVENDDPIKRGESLMLLWDSFEELFQRKVDLLTDASIKNPVLRKSINDTKIRIYDGESQKVSL